MTDRPNESKLSALNIRRALDASLRRLQTDYIDIYQFHHVDRDTPWEEIWQAMEVAVQQGKILYCGSSNFAGWHIAQAQAAAAQRNFTGLVSEQSIYNLLVRAVELEVIPAAESYGVGIIPWSPLQGGLLGGVLRKEVQGVRRLEGRARESLEAHRDQIQQYEDLADELGHRPAMSPSRGCWRNPRSPHRSSAPAPRSSSTQHCGRWTSYSTRRRSPGWTRSSPVTGPPPRTTPGDPQEPRLITTVGIGQFLGHRLVVRQQLPMAVCDPDILGQGGRCERSARPCA